MKQRRVVVTGMGTINACGLNINEYWNNIKNGKSGITKISNIDLSDSPSLIGGEVKNSVFRAENMMDKKMSQRMDRFTQFGFIAAEEAIKDSGLDAANINKDKAGVIIGSGIGGISTFYDNSLKIANEGRRRISPFFIPMIIVDITSGHVSIQHGFRGPNYSVSSACATAAHSIACSINHIISEDADVMVTGGTEATISNLAYAGFTQAHALSTRYNDTPEKASRPWDKDRDGFVMAEGAGIFVIEELEHALKRGAKIYCEIASYGMSADAYHITLPVPDGAGAALAMKHALEKAGLKPEDIQLINAHGTSTQPGDIAETGAIKSVFGAYASKLKVNSTKSIVGHTLGAAGAIEGIAVVKMIQEGIAHPTINLDSPDPQCDLDYVPNKAQKFDIKHAMSNSFGFGGHNISLLFKKYE